MMPLNKIFDTIEETREHARWDAAFGEPQVVEGKTLIPVAKVGYAFGLGFGQGTGPVEEEGEEGPAGEGAGGGGGASAKPMGAIVVEPERVYFQEAMDEGKVALAGIVLAGWIVLQLGLTVRALFGRR
jgi:uncharacterized spore protein YtfJ